MKEITVTVEQLVRFACYARDSIDGYGESEQSGEELVTEFFGVEVPRALVPQIPASSPAALPSGIHKMLAAYSREMLTEQCAFSSQLLPDPFTPEQIKEFRANVGKIDTSSIEWMPIELEIKR